MRNDWKSYCHLHGIKRILCNRFDSFLTTCGQHIVRNGISLAICGYCLDYEIIEDALR